MCTLDDDVARRRSRKLLALFLDLPQTSESTRSLISHVSREQRRVLYPRSKSLGSTLDYSTVATKTRAASTVHQRATLERHKATDAKESTPRPKLSLQRQESVLAQVPQPKHPSIQVDWDLFPKERKSLTGHNCSSDDDDDDDDDDISDTSLSDGAKHFIDGIIELAPNQKHYFVAMLMQAQPPRKPKHLTVNTESSNNVEPIRIRKPKRRIRS